MYDIPVQRIGLEILFEKIECQKHQNLVNFQLHLNKTHVRYAQLIGLKTIQDIFVLVLDILCTSDSFRDKRSKQEFDHYESIENFI